LDEIKRPGKKPFGRLRRWEDNHPNLRQIGHEEVAKGNAGR